MVSGVQSLATDFDNCSKPPSRLYRAKISDLFEYSLTRHYLLPKMPSELGPAFQFIAARFAKNIGAGRVTFGPFFLCAG
ncbi:hypothetical protein BD408DRAFT_414846 [Parasitella parasitica]|nr:hypothetical protein BD408DRAFT_414846 [Parasitella parasitica]